MSDAASLTSSFEIKSANLPLVALLLKSPNLNDLQADWLRQFGENSDFFDGDWLVIDLSPLSASPHAHAPIDFHRLVRWLRQNKIAPIAVKGGTPAHLETAQAAGLLHAPEVVLTKTSKTISVGMLPNGPLSAPQQQQQQPSPVPAPPSNASGLDTGFLSDTQAQKINAIPAPVVIAEALPALVIDKPLRSGQRVYARKRDLVVLAMVNAGAEVVADGHIHVYAPLRGKAIAGASGDTTARVFSLGLEPELISIAGVYRTSEVPLPVGIAGKPAMVWLQSDTDGDRLRVEPIKP